MERKEKETYKSYLTRIINAKENGQITYDEMGDFLVDDNRWVSDNWRKFYYIAKEVVKKLDEDIEYTQDDAIREMEDMKIELYKEKVKLRDQRRELNKLHTKQARFENLVEVVKERLEDIGTLPREKYYKPLEKEKGATLIVSDLHYGIKVDNQFNYYDTEVAEDRLKQLTNKTIQYCKKHDVSHLNIELLGDLISGSIHTGVRVQQEEDIIQQIIDCAELLSNMVNDLAEHIENVTVYSVYGNHGRTESNKHDAINRENYERLIYYFMKNRVKGVRFIDSQGEDFIKYYDFGKTFVISHGDKDKQASAIEVYSKMLGEQIGEVHLGHWHEFKEIGNVIVNGSVVGSDDYAVSIRKHSKPCQVLKVYGEDECTYKLILE
jgi:hypothetical protein|nr:MAG TPA: DNA polymerase II small subunit [Caudoviricetes sp.]